MTTRQQQDAFPWPRGPRPRRIYGAATVGERGQIALPAEARRELGIRPGQKVIVFGNQINGTLTLVKADLLESAADFVIAKLNKLGETTQDLVDIFTAEATEADDDTQAGEPDTGQPGDDGQDNLDA